MALFLCGGAMQVNGGIRRRGPLSRKGARMHVLALDIGEKRIGIAHGATPGKIATPVKILPTAEVMANARSWRMVLEDYEPELLVCGCPKSMSGSRGQQARRVMDAANKIAQACDLPVEFVDERLSSSEAKRYLREQGLSERDMRGKVDAVAASIFLSTWLEQQES